MARDGNGSPTTFTGPYIYTYVALLAFGTILVSAINIVCYRDWHVARGITSLFLTGVVFMTGVFVIVLTTAEEVSASHKFEVYLFLLLWIGYPFAYVILYYLSRPYCYGDYMFAVLDIACKGIFALWMVHVEF